MIKHKVCVINKNILYIDAISVTGRLAVIAQVQLSLVLVSGDVMVPGSTGANIADIGFSYWKT